jgi:hypothetical protein
MSLVIVSVVDVYYDYIASTLSTLLECLATDGIGLLLSSQTSTSHDFGETTRRRRRSSCSERPISQISLVVSCRRRSLRLLVLDCSLFLRSTPLYYRYRYSREFYRSSSRSSIISQSSRWRSKRRRDGEPRRSPSSVKTSFHAYTR